MALRLIPLHTQTNLIKPCISLLFDEWPDGKHERLETLEACCPNPPCSLVLVSNEEGSSDEDIVVGHSRIVPVKNSENTVYIELVVIDKSRRGRGLGSRVLQMTEEYCAERGFKTIFLKTHPLRHMQFYLRLGYRFTDTRPHVVGGAMLDTVQMPLSSPYPGWECYHQIYDGSVYKLPSETDIPTWTFDVDGFCFLKKDI